MFGSENTEIILIFFIGTFAMVLLAAAIIFFFITYQKRLLRKELEINRVKADQQEELLRNIVSAQEKERKRIARDLHDEVGAMLSVVKLNVSRIEKITIPDNSKVLANETKTYLDEVITQVRGISRALLPPSLEKLGLYFALEELANWINKSGQIKVACWKSGDQVRFSEKRELAVFRIIQELINNAIKHADASGISIHIRFISGKLAVLVSDNGKGFNVDEKMNTGLGLKNLESRTQMLDAKFKIKSVPEKGTTAIICIQTEN
jgi:signal transduction histidine kinase